MSETPVQRFDPVKEFITIRDNLTRTLSKGLKLVPDDTEAFPAINIVETDDAVIIRAQAIAGLVSESLEVAFENDILFISGKINPDEAETSALYLLQEIHVGSFVREIPIPRAVDATNAQASLKQGVLRIHMPKL